MSMREALEYYSDLVVGSTSSSSSSLGFMELLNMQLEDIGGPATATATTYSPLFHHLANPLSIPFPFAVEDEEQPAPSFNHLPNSTITTNQQHQEEEKELEEDYLLKTPSTPNSSTISSDSNDESQPPPAAVLDIGSEEPEKTTTTTTKQYVISLSHS